MKVFIERVMIRQQLGQKEVRFTVISGDLGSDVRDNASCPSILVAGLPFVFPFFQHSRFHICSGYLRVVATSFEVIEFRSLE